MWSEYHYHRDLHQPDQHVQQDRCRQVHYVRSD
nr:MAG TPA: hypothetical protein [Caudoviricetes sp.]